MDYSVEEIQLIAAAVGSSLKKTHLTVQELRKKTCTTLPTMKERREEAVEAGYLPKKVSSHISFFPKNSPDSERLAREEKQFHALHALHEKTISHLQTAIASLGDETNE